MEPTNGKQVIEAQSGAQATEHSDQPAQHEGNKADEPLPAMLPQPFDTPTTQPATAEQLQQVEREMTSFERATLNFAKLAFAVSVVAAIFVGLQWKVMRDTLTEMRTSGSTSTDQIWQAIGNMNWLARTADGSLRQAQRGVDLSEQQNKTSLNASINISRNDQRAWVSVKSCDLVKEPGAGEGYTAICNIENTGKTPAISLTWVDVIGTSSTQPPAPDWSKIPAKAAITLSPGDASKTIRTSFIPATEQPQRSSELASIEDYRRSVNRIWVWIHVAYADVFGRPHFTDTCMSHAVNSGLSLFTACDTGNRIDANNQQRPN